MTLSISFMTMPSPIGELTLAANDAGLVAVYFERNRYQPTRDERLNWRPASASATGQSRVLASARDQLEAYFAGSLTAFDLPLAASGTPFQHQVWAELRKIPFGALESYGGLARKLGDAGAARAVGAANGRNPIPIIVPCHRVVGADGSLTGFGGGIERKRWLLEHEGAVLL